MEQVAGRSLNPKIQTVARQIHFLQDCNISDPLGCTRQGQTNVSQLLGTLSYHMGELETQGQQEPWPVKMSNCTYVRCRTDTPDPTSETASLPALTYSRQKQERTLVSRASPQTGGLVLLILVPTLLCLSFTLWQLRQRLWRQRTQVPEEMGT
ncbi:fms-related tyrosine kinase 3 ligand [Alligator sinensis]|uniref:Fms-related tyrosine kinase 3 ligand n=1 Tax=Alligator sinensis TaxID=38654 RepID=A0A3Q0G1V2_ALLSI|nr:fms-related tyrosine kinase 3 ligand [Alligator sinensis]